MDTENATTLVPQGQAAISPEEKYEREFGEPMPDKVGESKAHLSNGQPDEKPAAEQIPEKFKGKSVLEVSRSAEESERRMHEATAAQRQAEQSSRIYQEQASQDRTARLRYEQMLADRQSQQNNQSQQVRQEFTEKVAADPEVFNTVEKLGRQTAREEVSRATNSRFDALESQNQQTRVQTFNTNLQLKMMVDPELAANLPEIRNVARQQLDYMRDTMLAQGVDPHQVQSTIDRLDVDMNFVDSCKRQVIGSKGKDYWAGVLKQPNGSTADDDAKTQLGGAGGGNNPDDGEVTERAFTKMTLPEMRKHLESTGQLKAKAGRK